jgi:hypothetical protein
MVSRRDEAKCTREASAVPEPAIRDHLARALDDQVVGRHSVENFEPVARLLAGTNPWPERVPTRPPGRIA